jgi:hypothetical protein
LPRIRWFSLLLVQERVVIWLIEALYFQVNIQIGPIQVVAVKESDIEELVYRGLLKPRVMIVVQEILLVLNQDPEPMRRNIGDFSR